MTITTANTAKNIASISVQPNGSIDLIFNGIRYKVALPVHTTLEWKAYRFGYEYDFVYKDRGFFGVLKITRADRRVTDYTIAGAAHAPRVVIVDQPRIAGYELVEPKDQVVGVISIGGPWPGTTCSACSTSGSRRASVAR